jgi:hypothetical protein
MEWLAHLLNLPFTPWVIAGVLILGTFFVAIRWWKHGKDLRSEVEEIRRVLGVSTALSIRDEAERWNCYATENFEAAKERLYALSENDPLARQTLTYLNRCEPVEEAGSNRLRLETTVDPSHALRLSEHLMERNVQVSLYRAFPNYLVGIGLCITFLGLAVVIAKASSVLTPGQDGGSSVALHDLLVAASSKFWSSLTAVFCSIAYGIRFRKQSQDMARLVALLARDLGRCVKFISTDELHYESVQRLRKCEEYQSTTANKIGLLVTGMNDTQANSADQHRVLLEKLEAVADGLNGKLGQLGDDLGTKIGSMGTQVAGSLRQVNEKAFADIAKQMTDSLHKATEVHLKSISERLEAVSATLSKLPGEFEVLVGLVQENTTSIASAFANAVKPIETSLAAASNSAQDVASKFATLPDALEPARAAARDLTSAASIISELVGRIYSQNETVVKRWEELSSLIQDVDTHLAGAVERVGGVFPAYAEKLQDFSQKWESAMVAALGGLASNIKDLAGSHEELRTQRTVWHDSADAVARSVDAVNVHITRFTAALGAHSEEQALPRQSTHITTHPVPAAPASEGEMSLGIDTGTTPTTAVA